MPLNDGIDFYYKTDAGQYNFDPRPLFTVGKELIKTPSNTGIATKYTLTLEGHVLPTGLDLDDHKGSMHKVFRSGDLLRQAFDEDFGLLYLKCDSESSPIISGYPKVISLDMRNAADNYVRRLDYTIILELPSLVGDAYDTMGISTSPGCGSSGSLDTYGLLSYTDEWSVEFLDERVGSKDAIFDDPYPSVFSITRNISAQGNSLGCPDGEYIEPWKKAHLYIKEQLGVGIGNAPPEYIQQLTGLLCTKTCNFANEIRNIGVNQTEGTVTATQAWIASTGGAFVEDLDISIEKSSDTAITSVTVNGSIQGLAVVNYGGSDGGDDGCPPDRADDTKTKFHAASGAFYESIAGKAYNRAKYALMGYLGGGNDVAGNDAWTAAEAKGRELKSGSVSESIGYNIAAGIVNYTVVFDNRCEFYHTGALVETINYTENDPADIFASLVILGRAKGPLLQSIGTVGPRTAELQIDAIFDSDCPDVGGGAGLPKWPTLGAPPYITNDTDGYGKLVKDLEEGFAEDEYVVFSNGASKSWDANAGHFTYSKSWTLGLCD